MMTPHEGFMTFVNDTGSNGWAKAYLVPHEKHAAILVAQQLFSQPAWTEADYRDTMYLGFVMSSSVKKALAALSSNAWDKGDVNSPCLLQFTYQLRTSKMIEDIEREAESRELKQLCTSSDGTPVVEKLCAVLKKDFVFDERTENDRPVLIKSL